MNSIISVLVFFIIFGVLVIVHEGGHFLIAKANGIRVKEFTVGVGPQLLHKRHGETVYSIRMLPFGGACIFDGMAGFDDDDGEDEDGEAVDSMREEGSIFAAGDEHSFPNAKVWARIATVFAGPLFNFLIAFLIGMVVTGAGSWEYPVVTRFTEDSAAYAAGLREGDTILRMDGSRIHMAGEVRLLSQFNEGKEIVLTVDRDGETKEISFMPSWSEADGRYYMGVYIGEFGKVTGAQILPYSWYTVKYYFTATYRSLWLLIRGRLGADALSGPVGMVKMVDDTIEQTAPAGIPAVVLTLMELTLLLSVNLGVMNLLPVPALDGGRLMFLFLEVLRGKPIPPEKEGFVHLAGIIALAALMVFVLFNDIRKFMG